ASASLRRVSPAAVVVETAGVAVELELQQWPMPTVRGRQRGTRWRFICGRCGASRDALHWHPELGWGCPCKTCITAGGVGYPGWHRMRYCKSLPRRERLRRKLIRAIPGSLRARELREKIKREERTMVAHMRRVSDDLTKRSERNGRHRRATE